AAREPLNGITRLDRDHPDVERLCGLAFRKRHASKGADRFAEGPIDIRAHTFGCEDKAINIAPEPHRVEPEYPLIAFGGGGCRRQAVDGGLLDALGVDVLDPPRIEIGRQRLLRRYTHHVHAQGLSTSFPYAEHRLGGVVERELFRLDKSEA